MKRIVAPCVPILLVVNRKKKPHARKRTFPCIVCPYLTVIRRKDVLCRFTTVDTTYIVPLHLLALGIYGAGFYFLAYPFFRASRTYSHGSRATYRRGLNFADHTSAWQKPPMHTLEAWRLLSRPARMRVLFDSQAHWSGFLQMVTERPQSDAFLAFLSRPDGTLAAYWGHALALVQVLLAFR